MIVKRNISSKTILMIILVISVLIRIPGALLMGDEPSYLPGVYDEISYTSLAHSLLNGNGFSFDKSWYPFTNANTPTAHWSFLYPIYLAAVYLLFGEHPLAARLIQTAIAGIFTSLFIYLIGRKLFNEKVGLIAAGLTAFYGYFIYYNAALMTESFFILTILISIYLFLKIQESNTLLNWVLFGIVLGVAILLRQTALFLAPILMVLLVWGLSRKIRWRHLAASIVCIMLCILPWTYRNYQVYGQFLLMNSNSGYALYSSLNPIMGTFWDSNKVIVAIPSEILGQNEAQMDKALSAMSRQFVIQDPGRIFLLTLSKLLEYFKFWPSANSGLVSNLTRVLSFGIYLPFMVFGFILSLSRWREYLLLYIPPVVFAGLHVLSWPAPRYRLPSDAIMMLFAALAVNYLLSLHSKKSQSLPRIPSIVS